MEFAALPESLLEDLAEFFVFVTQHCPEVLKDFEFPNSPLSTLVTLLITLAGSSKHVRNPYLRAKFIEVLAYLQPSKDARFVAASSCPTLCSHFAATNVARSTWICTLRTPLQRSSLLAC
jgi:hypothetical protein